MLSAGDSAHTLTQPLHPDNPTVVGVLALQGDFAEHAASLRRVGATPLEVRTQAQLDQVDGLIIPGGESTTISRLMIQYDLREPVVRMGRDGFPIWGTCAGAILLATEIETLDRPALHLLPMTIERNAYGRQIDSFGADLPSGALGGPPLHAIFIRAPRIRSVGPDVDVLLRLEDEPVAVQSGSLMASTFHPELTNDGRLHARFTALCTQRRDERRTPLSPRLRGEMSRRDRGESPLTTQNSISR